jgi:hypothetical protein
MMEFEDLLEDQRVDRGRGPRDAAKDRVGEDALTMAKVECVDIRLVSAPHLVMRYPYVRVRARGTKESEKSGRSRVRTSLPDTRFLKAGLASTTCHNRARERSAFQQERS